MARFTKPARPSPSQADSGLSSVQAAGLCGGAVRHLPRPSPEQRERYERLAATVIRVGDPQMGRIAVREAARLRCMLPVPAASTDRYRTQTIARFIALEAAVFGVVDVRRAFHRANVDRYIHDRLLTTARSLREARTVLYEAGRRLYPREYPAARVLPAPRIKREPAATEAAVRRMRSLVHGVPEALGAQLEVFLDLGLGVGARPSDLLILRGASVEITHVRDTGDVVGVRLPNRQGGSRLVPVRDPAIADRLVRRATEVSPAGLLLTGGATSERNLANRVPERLRNHGHDSVTLAALRGRWIVDLSGSVPAALLMHLCDVVDIRVLADQRSILPTYSDADAARTVRGGKL